MQKLLTLWIVLWWALAPQGKGSAVSVIELLDQNGKITSALTDGDLVSLRLKLDRAVAADTVVDFTLSGAAAPSAACAIPQGQSTCTTAPFPAYGWYWSTSAQGDGQPQQTRQVHASLDGSELAESLSITIRPRPVILVHGFLSNFAAWSNYLGPQGYLSQAGLPGYAVGDGQVAGTMKTGNIAEPAMPTNTIAQNAEILAQYIRNVKKQTGAQQVDLIGHSMGGLISRYYIDRLMQTRDVAQLILLGTPSSGSDCAILPAALGFYYPTVLEIRSSYMTQVFNQQIKLRRGVPFFALAGTRITSPVGSPCTEVPNDMVVSVGSVASIGLTSTETPILHVEMNTSPEIFTDYVLPLLQRGAAESWEASDPAANLSGEEPLQFSRVYTGHVNPGESSEEVIELEPGLSVANFGLYDPSGSLEVQVTGSSGKQISLDAAKNGLITVADPATLVSMGYGFENPRPGPWIIRLTATARTPAAGADYALTANLRGGAVLTAAATPLLPRAGETVQVSASLSLGGLPLVIQSAEAFVRTSGGPSVPLSVTIKGNAVQGDWQPTNPGIHAIDLRVTALHPEGAGAAIERSAYLTVEAQSAPAANDPLPRWLLLGGLCLLALFLFFALLIAGYRWISRSNRQKRG